MTDINITENKKISYIQLGDLEFGDYFVTVYEFNNEAGDIEECNIYYVVEVDFSSYKRYDNKVLVIDLNTDRAEYLNNNMDVVLVYGSVNIDIKAKS